MMLLLLWVVQMFIQGGLEIVNVFGKLYQPLQVITVLLLIMSHVNIEVILLSGVNAVTRRTGLFIYLF